MSLVDLIEEFQCIVCTEYLFPPSITECHFGHIVCDECSEKLAACPLCKSSLQNLQNYSLELLHSKLTFPCKYHHDGCKFTGKAVDLKKHYEVCDYCPQACFNDNMWWIFDWFQYILICLFSLGILALVVWDMDSPLLSDVVSQNVNNNDPKRLVHS